jgi:hypothetical protein
MGRRAVHLLILPVNPAEILLECSGSILELLLAGQTMSIEHGLVPLEAVPSPASSFESQEPSRWSSCDVCHVPAALLASLTTMRTSRSPSESVSERVVEL